MAKSPAFQFYPADWLGDIKLQSCSMSAQGLMINLMCLMHQSSEYGVLLVNGSIPDLKTVAKLTRNGQKKFQKWFHELVQNGVVKIREDGAVYCKRMVEDEDLREKRRIAGSKGGNPVLLNQKVNQGSNQKPTPSSSSSSSSSSSEEKDSKNTPPYTPPGGGEVQDLSESPSPEQKPKTAKKQKQKPTYSEAFEFFWSEYPLKVGKGKAWESWEKLDIDDQRAAYRAIKAQVQAQQFRNVDGVDNPPHPSTWLNQRRFEDSPRSPTPAVNSRSNPGCGPVYGGMKITTVHQGLVAQNDAWARELLASMEVEANGADTRSGAEEPDKPQRALSGQGIE